MSSANSSLDEINAIKYHSRMFFQFWAYLLISLGSVGHSLNAYVFTRPGLRSNPCVRYFLASTITGFIVALINMPLRLLQYMYGYDVFGYSVPACKILTLIVTWSRAQTHWFIAIASIDRFLCSSSSVALRAWSTPHVALRTILFSTALCGLSYIYLPLQYDLRKTMPRCSGNQGDHPLFNGIWNLLIFSLAPALVMLVFGLFTIRNIQESVKRVSVYPINQRLQNLSPSMSLHDHLRRQRNITDRQLIQMMLVQSCYFILWSTPVSAWYIYDSLRMNMVIDALQKSKDDAFSIITGVISITGGCTSFYIFTLSSKLFRRELSHLFNVFMRS